MRIFLILFLLIALRLNAQSSFSEKTTSASEVNLTFSSTGIFGNSFKGYFTQDSTPSCKYPDDKKIEHIFEGGVWFGGIKNGIAHVSTAAIDENNRGAEFTVETGNTITERSNCDTSRFFHREAMAEQEFVYRFSDKNVVIPGTNTSIINHTPLNIEVESKIYNFNRAESSSVVFVEMTFKNSDTSSVSLIDSAYIGVYLNAVVKNITNTPIGTGGSSFYNKGGNGFIDSLNVAYTYDHSSDTNDFSTYIGQVILGAEDKNGFMHPSTNSAMAINYNAWEYNNPGSGVFNSPSSDVQKFNRLKNGIENLPCWTMSSGCGGQTFQELLNDPGNRSDLISIGPFNDFRSGDSIKFTFAFVLAEKKDDGMDYDLNTEAQQEELRSRVRFAQNLYNGEDVNFNGILDAGEDKDNNGKISRYYSVENYIDYAEETTSKSKVSLTFSSTGILGNSFRGYGSQDSVPSCTYSENQKIEHIYKGGVWVGGIKNGTTRVSTSATNSKSASEFTSHTGHSILERSNEDTSSFFNPEAIASQEFMYEFTDKNVSTPGTGLPILNHMPLDINVSSKIYNFNREESSSVVFVEMTFTNEDVAVNNSIDSLYLGVYLNAVIRNLDNSPIGAGGLSFFNKGGNGFIDSLNVAYSFDQSADTSSFSSYIGQVILGAENKNGFIHPDLDSSIAINYNAWKNDKSDSGFFISPDSDIKRFNRLKSGMEDLACWTMNSGCGGKNIQEQLNNPEYRSDLISMGPFNDFKSGDSIKFTFALVLAEKINDGMAYQLNTTAQQKELRQRVQFAQTLYNGEDVNFNGVLDPGEDKDKDGKITRYYNSVTFLTEYKKANQGFKFNNPVNENLRISLVNHGDRLDQIEIISFSGQILLIETPDNNSAIINVGELPAGIYFIRVTTNGYQQSVEKLIKI